MDKTIEEYELVHVETGEVVDRKRITGTISGIEVYTHEQDKYNELRKIIDHKTNGLPQILSDEYGSYVHSYFELQEPYLKAISDRYKGTYANIHIVRFLLLASYITSSGYIVKNGNKLKKSALKRIWELDKNDANNEFKMLLDIGYLYTDDNDYILVNPNIVNKGTAQSNSQYTRIFNTTIQQLYYGTPVRKRGQLAYVYRLIPYVNKFHNIVCSNPQEPNREKIKRLNWNQLGELCGYHKAQIKRFRDTLESFKYRNEYLIGQFIVDKDKVTIIVNPSVYYAGSDPKQLEFIATLFRLE